MKMLFAAVHESGIGLAQQSVAIGGGADMDDRAAMDDGDVNDPLQTISALTQ
jgi:hypothetical protein